MAPFGAYGRSGEPGVVAVLREDLGLATLAARKGSVGALKVHVATAFDLTLADGPRAVGGPDLALLGIAPGRWLAVSQTRADLADQLAAALGDHAAVTEQSDALIAFDLAGPRVLDLLAKGVTIDLHPAVFKPGDVAVTDIAHIGATLWRTGEIRLPAAGRPQLRPRLFALPCRQRRRNTASGSIRGTIPAEVDGGATRASSRPHFP